MEICAEFLQELRTVPGASGTNLISLGGMESTIEAIQHAIKVEPRASLPHLVIAGIWTRMDRHEEAVGAFRAALEIQPDTAGALLGLGHALRTIGRHDDAVKTYQKLAARYPDFGKAYWSLANLKNVSFRPDEIEAME